MVTKTKQKPKEEEEELELEEDALEEDEEIEEDEVPAKKKKTTAEDEVTFGASDLAKLLSKAMGKEIKTKDLRTLLRKMAREDDPRINREVIAGNKTRYSWSGPSDPEVKAIVKAVKAGELEQGKKEALAKLKEKKAAQASAERKTGKATKKKAKPAPVEDDDDEEFTLDDDEE